MNEYIVTTNSRKYSVKLTNQEEAEVNGKKIPIEFTSIGGPTSFTFAADTHKMLLSKRFQNSQVYLGRLTADEKKLLFPDEPIASVALLLLGNKGELGMLAIGNHDAGHFEPAMDTLLVRQLQALLSKLLPPL